MKKKSLLNIILSTTLILSACSEKLSFSEIELNTSKKELKQDTIQLEQGDVADLKGSVEFSDGNTTTDVIWSSLAPDIIKVEENGRVTAILAGEAKLKVTAKKDSSKFSIITIKVNPLIDTPVKEVDSTEGKLTKEELDSLNNKTNPSASPKPNEPIKPSFENATLIGKVFDANGNVISEADIKITSIDKSFGWNSEVQKTIDGSFNFKNVPINVLLKITVSKEGFTERTRIEVLKGSNNSTINLNFGGYDAESVFALQEEPQIISTTINSKKIVDSGFVYPSFDSNIPPEENTKTSLVLSKATSLNIELTFSKSINTTSFENAFQISSQKISGTNNSILFSKNLNRLTFSWSNDNKKVIISSNLIPQNTISTIYRLQFIQPFSSTDGKDSIVNKSFYSDGSNKIFDYIVLAILN